MIPIDIKELSLVDNYPPSLRMRYFDCNDPSTTGYSIATTGYHFAWIHAHRQDDDLRFYKDVSLVCTWVYMPVDKGERLVEIWCPSPGFAHPTGLLVRQLSRFLRRNMF